MRRKKKNEGGMHKGKERRDEVGRKKKGMEDEEGEGKKDR